MIRKAHLGGSAIPLRACPGVLFRRGFSEDRSPQGNASKNMDSIFETHVAHAPPNSVLENARVWRTMGA